MYMIGQVAALRASKCTLAELHADLSQGSADWLASLAALESAGRGHPGHPPISPSSGMGCILPGAPDLQTFWANILGKVDAIYRGSRRPLGLAPVLRPGPRSAKDKVYSRWGGFIDDVPFDPSRYGMPPNTLNSIEPFQLLGLMVVRPAH